MQFGTLHIPFFLTMRNGTVQSACFGTEVAGFGPHLHRTNKVFEVIRFCSLSLCISVNRKPPMKSLCGNLFKGRKVTHVQTHVHVTYIQSIHDIFFVKTFSQATTSMHHRTTESWHNAFFQNAVSTYIIILSHLLTGCPQHYCLLDICPQKSQVSDWSFSHEIQDSSEQLQTKLPSFVFPTA